MPAHRDDSPQAVMESVRHVLDMVEGETGRALKHGAAYASAHEAYGVLREEVHEFEAWVFRKRNERDRVAMIEELVQVAAVATKYAAQLRRDALAAVAPAPIGGGR